MQHIIQKQTFDISAPSLELVQHWEKHAHDLTESVINPTIDKCFEQESTKENTLIIDQIQIDLGNIKALTDQEIKDKVTNTLMQELARYTNESPSHSLLQLSEYQSEGSSRGELHKYGDIVDSFIYFLVHGRLPWWVNPETFELMGDWVSRLSKRQTELIAKELSANIFARNRMVSQFDDEFISILLGYYNHGISKTLLNSWRWLEKMGSSISVNIRKLRKVYWDYWISKCIGFSDTENLIVHVFSKLIKSSTEFKHQIQKIVKIEPRHTKKSSYSSEEKAVATSMSPIFVNALEAANKVEKGDIKDLIEDVNNFRPTDKSHKKLPQKEEKKTTPIPDTEFNNDVNIDISTKQSRTDFKEEEIDNIYPNDIRDGSKESQFPSDNNIDPVFCEAAGLVIIHPFLEELFRTLHLWDGDQWTSESSQHQAVFLVAWLSYGKHPLPEYVLTIPKLLCGMPSEEVIDTSVTLGEAFFKTCTVLMETVISHWKAIGNTSVEGLREGFIRREGKLTFKEPNWHLVVERKAQDILLNRLPWGISFIRLPWMGNKSIHVDWN